MVHSDKSSVQNHEVIHDIYSLDDVPSIDRVYHAKARLLNNAVQDIGMGRYQVSPRPVRPIKQSLPIVCTQWMLFIVAGFGWFADNLWPVRSRTPQQPNEN